MLALVALAVHSSGHHHASLAVRKSATSKLWTHEGADGSTSGIQVSVTEQDIDNLGLRAPAGFNIPSVNVSEDDIARCDLPNRMAGDILA